MPVSERARLAHAAISNHLIAQGRRLADSAELGGVNRHAAYNIARELLELLEQTLGADLLGTGPDQAPKPEPDDGLTIVQESFEDQVPPGSELHVIIEPGVMVEPCLATIGGTSHRCRYTIEQHRTEGVMPHACEMCALYWHDDTPGATTHQVNVLATIANLRTETDEPEPTPEANEPEPAPVHRYGGTVVALRHRSAGGALADIEITDKITGTAHDWRSWSFPGQGGTRYAITLPIDPAPALGSTVYVTISAELVW